MHVTDPKTILAPRKEHIWVSVTWIISSGKKKKSPADTKLTFIESLQRSKEKNSTMTSVQGKILMDLEVSSQDWKMFSEGKIEKKNYSKDSIWDRKEALSSVGYGRMSMWRTF